MQLILRTMGCITTYVFYYLADRYFSLSGSNFSCCGLPDSFSGRGCCRHRALLGFTVLSDRTLLFLADFDGDLGPLILDLAKRAGPVFDVIVKHVNDPPPTPVANNADAFADWVAGHLLQPAYVFSAYPGPTAQEIRAMAAGASVKGETQLLPFLVILPIRIANPIAGVPSAARRRGGNSRQSRLIGCGAGFLG
jgi:hypothetical protein